MLMVGMEDGWIALAWWLSILTPIAGAVYGLLNWNREGKIVKVKQEDEGVNQNG
ncbi:hypothetical protein MWH28_11920 [Natroniella sulfidigena]|uniref:symporter small accessory protein n=1 Tax=Natroniella sulfidigena TaxID=723921 RepID=UPI00200B9A7E|nr:symporter small accessory protein [Natroniella sulfidigena]MCK8818065.1 hypothetical protein [Natroniella sulfidigena]